METIVSIRKPKAMGRVTNILSDPLDINSDWRKAISPMGLRMKAINKGAEANSNFIMKKPSIPKKIMMPISNMECWMA